MGDITLNLVRDATTVFGASISRQVTKRDNGGLAWTATDKTARCLAMRPQGKVYEAIPLPQPDVPRRVEEVRKLEGVK